MKKFVIKGQLGTVEQTVTVSAETAERALEDAKQYFPVYMHYHLSVSVASDAEKV